MSGSHVFSYYGKAVRYWQFGEPTLPTIVMVHGFRGTHHGLQRIVDQLPGFHIIVPDLPGFGESEPFSVTHSLDHYVEFLEAFVRSFHFAAPVTLLGHSFGSIIASHYAASAPRTIKNLILINPIGAPALEGPKAILTKLAIFYYWLGRKLPRSLSGPWLANPLIVKIMSVSMAKTRDPATRRFVHVQHLEHFSTFANPQVVAEAFEASVTHDVREVAANITLPTLLIVGDLDDITPLKRQQALAALFPRAHLAVIQNVGHLIHYEMAEQAANLIDDFMKQSD